MVVALNIGILLKINHLLIDLLFVDRCEITPGIKKNPRNLLSYKGLSGGVDENRT